MSRNTSGPRTVTQEPSSQKCAEKGQNAACPVENDQRQLPVIADSVQTKPSTRDARKEASKLSFGLPKLAQDRASDERIGAGEPNGSDCSIFSADFVPSRQACEGLKQFQKLGASSSEELRRLNTSESQNLSDRSSGRSKIFETLTELRPDNETIEESHALKRWEFWLKEKKKIQNRLSQRLGRPVCDLLMQESDKYREVMEKKLMRWYSRIPEPDKWRGSPARWKPQLRIRNKKTQAQYCLIKSKLEKGERPELEFIGIPNPIKKEKGLICDDFWDDTKRREKPENERKVHCKEESTCGSHEIEMEELAVVGTRIRDNGVNSHYSFSPGNVPLIKEERLTEEQPSKCTERTSIFSLVIDEDEITYEIGSDSRQDPERVLEWNVNFGVNKTGSTVERVLRVENRGTIAVRYDWLAKKNEQKNKLGGLQPKRYEPWFFFNKNSGYFLPGQIYDLKFYFQAKTSGIRKETWCLRTSPPFSVDVEFATVLLSGVATEESSTELNALEFYLEKRVMKSCISVLMDVVLYKVFDPLDGLMGIEYRSFFTERQLFEYQNARHFYHSTIIKELKRIFEEIPDKPQTQWDLSLTSLWYLIKTYKTGKEQSASLHEVVEMTKALYRPNYMPVRDVPEYRMTYGVLCKMMDLIDEDYIYLRSLVSDRMSESMKWGDLGEAGGSTATIIGEIEELGESDSKAMLQIRPINFMFFRALLHLKVYRRMCEAVENIAGILETRKNFRPWKTVNYKPPKPPRVAKTPHVSVCSKFCRPEPHKPQVKILDPK